MDSTSPETAFARAYRSRNEVRKRGGMDGDLAHRETNTRMVSGNIVRAHFELYGGRIRSDGTILIDRLTPHQPDGGLRSKATRLLSKIALAGECDYTTYTPIADSELTPSLLSKVEEIEQNDLLAKMHVVSRVTREAA